MSGCLCPECGSPYLDAIVEGRVRCPLCAWRGVPEGPSVWLTDEGYEQWARQIARKRSGAYFVVLVRVAAGRDVAGEVATALGVDGFRVHRDGSLQAEVGARPSDETMSRLRSIDGVAGVDVV
jgi:hypothetical protein